MLRKLFAVVLMLGLMTMTPAISMAQDQGGKQEGGEHRRGKEQHPKIRQAIRALEAAKEDLEDASHDFGGHRVEALEAVNNALKQLKEALEADRK
jgi:hypothetical protein